MKNVSILSLLFVASTPFIAMEAQREVPTLKDLCFKALSSKDLIKFQFNSFPQLGLQLLQECPQEIIDQANTTLIQQCFDLDNNYPVEIRLALIEKLTLTPGEALDYFESMLSQPQKEYRNEKFLPACALFAKYKEELQTWKNGKRLAKAGPITLEAAHAIIQTIKTMDNLYKLFKENNSVLPDEMLNFGNDKLFEQAFYELSIKYSSAETNQENARNLYKFNSVKHLEPKLIECNSTNPKLEPDYSATTLFSPPADPLFSTSYYYSVLRNKQGEDLLSFPSNIHSFTISKNKRWCCVYQDVSLPWLYIIDLNKKCAVASIPFDDSIPFKDGVVEEMYFDYSHNENQPQLCIKEKNHNPVAIPFPWYYLENDMSIKNIVYCILNIGKLPATKDQLEEDQKDFEPKSFYGPCIFDYENEIAIENRKIENERQIRLYLAEEAHLKNNSSCSIL